MLTVYRGRIWAKSLFGASEALKELTQAQRFCIAKIGGRKDANRHHRIAKVFAVVKDEKVSMEETSR
jgi:hypothetical protein